MLNNKGRIAQTSIKSFIGRGKFDRVDIELLPHNEGKRKVASILKEDFSAASEISIVTGYASLDEILKAVNEKDNSQKMKILVGNEPSVGSLTTIKSSPRQLSEELKRYWLEQRSISLTHSLVLLNAYRKIESGEVVIRINSATKPLHAKICMTEKVVVLGSSNYTKPGLHTQREINTRFTVDDIERYDSASNFVEGCFEQSDDYSAELLELLKQLIRKTSWQEALACACWDMLDGMEGDDLLSKFNLNNTNLWPHQKQAISQGLGILREQGSVLVADATGSGKTKTGMWLMSAADAMIKNTQDHNPLSPDPIIVVPSAVEVEWKLEVRKELNKTPDVIGHGKMSYDYAEGTEGYVTRNRLYDTTVVLVDEAHNFYNNTSNRTTRLRDHGAQSSILLTATPINRGFDDLLALVELLSQDDFDEDLERKLKNLKLKVYSKNKEERKKARSMAANLVQEFTVRRTRFDLNRIAQIYPEEYIQENRIIPGFPKREKINYDLSLEESDVKILETIGRITNTMNGFAFLPEVIKITKEQKEKGVKEETIVKQTMALAKAGAKYRIWSTLASSKAACFEHLSGTESALVKFEISKFKSTNSVIPHKLRNRKIPIWRLNESLKENPSVPSWLVSQDDFEAELELEKSRYQILSRLISELGDGMEDSRAKLLIQHFNEGNKVLAFDWHLISLHRLKKTLIDSGIPEDRIHLFDSSNKGRAETYFGLQSDNEASIGLCSDSLNEGINLQGANVMVNLERPTTIRRFEQRMGRVDRMNSRHDQIIVQLPNLPDSISSHLNDHLTERLQLVREVLGGNDIDEEFGISKYDEQYHDEESDSSFAIEDAYSPVRKLIGEDGLISVEEYKNFGLPNARARSEISILKSEHPWCFFALRMSWNSSIKWALLHYQNKKPILTTDLKVICKFLRKNLSNDPTPPVDEIHSNRYVSSYFEELENQRNTLLPTRFRNSLKLGTEFFARKKEQYMRQDPDKYQRIKEIQIQFGMGLKDCLDREGEDLDYYAIDNFALAESWINKTNPIKRKALKDSDRRSSTKTRKDKFVKMLEQQDNFVEEIEQLIYNLPLQKPIEEDVRIVIAGVPVK